MNKTEKARIFMERFRGNPLVYGRRWTSKPDEEGKSVSGYAPVCAKFWSPGCHIKLKDGVTCARCEIKEYSAVTAESVLKHIEGVEAQIQYVVHQDGTVNFAAIDFDMKPGKEDKGYKFEDVQKSIRVFQSFGLPYGVARSTTAGFHIYLFFSEPVSAVKARSLLNEVFHRSNFIQESLQGLRPIPEMFPKQGQALGGLGNGIKCPMIEPNFAMERNCFVNDDNSMIPAAVQWDYLNSIQKISAAQLDAVLEKEQIPLMEDLVTGKSNRVGKSGYPQRERWQRPLSGSIHKVLEGCAALRRVKDKALAGTPPGHFEGMALWHLSMHTADGQDWFLKHTGWGQDQHQMRQLEHSVDKDYSPWTCKKLQESGVCVPGTKCFEKKPPVDWEDGMPVTRDDVPKEQWPEPSPIRYAFSAGDDYLQKLIKEVEELVDEENEERRTAAVADIIRRSLVFDMSQQELLKEKIEHFKLGKRAHLNRQFKEAVKQKESEFVEHATERGDSVIINGILYRKLSPHGFALLKMGKESSESLRALCNFDMIIDEERIVVDDDRTRSRIYLGRLISANGREYKFEVESAIWSDNTEFFKYFSQLCGSDFNILKMDVDSLRQVVLEYKKATREHTNYYGTQGWYDATYLTPDVLFDRDGVRPNTSKRVDLSNKGAASNINFKLLSQEELKDTLFHIKTEFFNAFHRGCLFMGLGHTMMALIHTYLDIKIRPTLWYEGDSGNGKTQLTILLSRFFGDFKSGLAWGTSVSSMMEYGHQFRDCLLVADDFKGENAQRVQAAKDTVQFAYDGNVVGKLTRMGQQRGDRKSRCLFMMTGEETPVNHASVIARMCLISHPTFDTNKTADLFAKCQIASDNYRGVTPYFGHWILQQDRNELHKVLKEDRAMLKKPINGTPNDDRVASNVGLAFTGFRFFVYFLLSSLVVTKAESEALIAEAQAFAEKVRDNMAVRCSEEKNGIVLINRLKELIFSGEARIENLEGFDNDNKHATVVGFVDLVDKEPHVAYLYPGTVLSLIKSKMHETLVASPQSIGTQLHAMGILVKTDKNRHQYKKRYKGGSPMVWAVSLEKLEITDGSKSMRTVQQTEPMQLQPLPNAEGLI